VRTAQLFVAALGASSYTYAEATWTQGLSDWIGSHTLAGDMALPHGSATVAPPRRDGARRSSTRAASTG
jgi:hypothetical protein